MDEIACTDDSGRLPASNLHLGAQCCSALMVKEERHEAPDVSACEGLSCEDIISHKRLNVDQAVTVVVKEEPEEILPTPTGESVHSEDSCGISTLTPYLEGQMRDTLTVKEELDDVSAVSTFEGSYHKDARCISSSHDHLVQDETCPVAVKEELDDMSAASTFEGSHHETALSISSSHGHLVEDETCSDVVKEEPVKNPASEGEGSTDEDVNSQHRFQEPQECQCKLTEADTEGPKGQCRICTYCSSFKDNVARHAGRRPFACSACQRTFTTKTQLREHGTIHTGKRSFQCDICQKMLRRKTDLRKHMRIHTGEGLLKCNTCGKIYTWYGCIKLHQRQSLTKG